MTDAFRRVDISGGKGVVVGDYATVFQTFADGSRPLSAFIRTTQFRSLVDGRTRDFVGRDFVFAEVERLLTSPEFPSGYVVIRGEPGIGKTAIAATLVLRGSYVHHFNIAPENIRSPRQFLENVCAQLIVRYELDHATLPAEAGQDAGFLSALLAEAAAAARDGGDGPVVVVVDALDEAEDSGLAPSANRLYLPRSLPDGVFFVVTTREEADYRLDVDRAEEIRITEDDPRNQADVRRYIESFVDDHGPVMGDRIRDWQVDWAGFVDEVAKHSEGNFMYLVHVLKDIELGRLSRDTVGTIEGLPNGLGGYYRRHWREMKDEDPSRFERLQRPVLCFLAISRQPVAVVQLAEWSLLEPGDVKQVITEWREFLNEDPDARPPRFRVYHRSFAEFLDEEENLTWYHDQIAQRALAKIPDFPDN
jgi:hypothetical protein